MQVLNIARGIQIGSVQAFVAIWSNTNVFCGEMMLSRYKPIPWIQSRNPGADTLKLTNTLDLEKF